MNTYTDNRNYQLCDRCGREIKGGYILSLGMKICYVCQWGKPNNSNTVQTDINVPIPNFSIQEGMTLRDYFAGQFLSSVAMAVAHDDKIYYDKVAEDCYKIADAMLKQREIKQQI